MKILAIDTSGSVCSAAVADEGVVLAELGIDMGRTHSTQILPAVDTVLAYADCKLNDMDVLALTVGPGSFTGIRIGIATIQGIAVGSDLNVLPLSTLSVLAEPYRSINLPILSLIDARHQRAYGSLYIGDRLLLDEQLLPLADFAQRILDHSKEELPEILVVGDGANSAKTDLQFHDRLRAEGILLRYAGTSVVSAASAARLADRLLREQGATCLDASLLRPSYLTPTAAERNLGISVDQAGAS